MKKNKNVSKDRVGGGKPPAEGRDTTDVYISPPANETPSSISITDSGSKIFFENETQLKEWRDAELQTAYEKFQRNGNREELSARCAKIGELYREAGGK